MSRADLSPSAVEGARAGRVSRLRSTQGQRQSGFTLIEMMVALAIFSLAALALLRLEGATVAQTAILADRTIGQIVARNIAVEALTERDAPPRGILTGQERNAGRTWLWVRTVTPTPDPRVRRIDVSVSDAAGQRAGMLTVFRLSLT
ncbi:type II secretion system minor pseudopilin GspI [Sphingomonas solaris]|uniref:Type II secretion system protein I n=1 Tax=Alterirhizorhabdus solaris TaxID=2529389 RepID=A0A558R4G6_9SPHN|nr:type II secretion system minor pseudopilin GspI [Sphingomonas solaris]TVV74232.1 type II secretion system protein GspI [Sphingomonas solaris]